MCRLCLSIALRLGSFGFALDSDGIGCLHWRELERGLLTCLFAPSLLPARPLQNPIKKVYMLYELDPSEEVSGGTWYTDNEFDGEFINKLSDYLYRVIAKDVGLERKEGHFPALDD